MTNKEVLYNLIDKYSELLRIEKDPNELQLQLSIVKAQLLSYDIDIESIEKAIKDT